MSRSPRTLGLFHPFIQCYRTMCVLFFSQHRTTSFIPGSNFQHRFHRLLVAFCLHMKQKDNYFIGSYRRNTVRQNWLGEFSFLRLNQSKLNKLKLLSIEEMVFQSET